MAGEGIWLRHLRTSAGGGGREGRAGELAQAAGTTGAHGPCSPVPFPVWPQPWASPGAECKRGRLHLTFPVHTTSVPCRRTDWARGKGLLPLPVPVLRGHVCLPLRSRVGPEPREEDSPFLVSQASWCWGAAQSPPHHPPLRPGSKQLRSALGKGSAERHPGPLEHPKPAPCLSSPTAHLPTTTASSTGQCWGNKRRGNHPLSKASGGGHMRWALTRGEELTGTGRGGTSEHTGWKEAWKC